MAGDRLQNGLDKLKTYMKDKVAKPEEDDNDAVNEVLQLATVSTSEQLNEFIQGPEEIPLRKYMSLLDGQEELLIPDGEMSQLEQSAGLNPRLPVFTDGLHSTRDQNTKQTLSAGENSLEAPENMFYSEEDAVIPFLINRDIYDYYDNKR